MKTSEEISADNLAKKQAIAYHKWTSEKGYVPRLDPDYPSPRWGWARQENQIVWSKWVNDEQLYDLFLEHQELSKQ